MAFNVNDFVKSTAKSAVNNILDSALQGIVGAVSGLAKSIPLQAAGQLFNVGASYNSVQALTSAKTDAIISGASDEFFALAGKVPSRTAGASVSTLRRSASEGIDNYIEKINPTTKIASKKRDDDLTFLSVL
jgi:hypothetical protein